MVHVALIVLPATDATEPKVVEQVHNFLRYTRLRGE